jgi:hypothetical protein
MAKLWARVAKISLIGLACIAGIASVLQTLPARWWLLALIVLAGSYWLLGHRDPWVSLSSLRETAYRIDMAQAARPSWVGAKASISSAAGVYFGASLLFLSTSQSDLSTGRAGIVTALAKSVGTVNLQLLSVLVGTCLLFWACETARAVQRHVNASGQIKN